MAKMGRPREISTMNYEALPPTCENMKEYRRIYMRELRKTGYNKKDQQYYLDHKEELNAKRAELYRRNREANAAKAIARYHARKLKEMAPIQVS